MPDLSAFRFTATHEWVRPVDGGVRIGITDHAQSQLGDIIFIDLPAVGTVLEAGGQFGSIESVKAASDLYAPVGGRVAQVNPSLADSPERVNSDPYGEGWMIQLEDAGEAGGDLLDEAAYTTLVEAE